MSLAQPTVPTMADEILGKLDTNEIAKGFNDFLESQGLGDMNPSSAARFRNGVQVSPMDEILSMNGFDIDSLFEKKIPEAPPLASLGSNSGETDSSTRSDESIQNAKAAVESLGLSADELATLGSLLNQGGSSSAGTLPAPMRELLFNNPGVSNAEDLILQLGELYGLLEGIQFPDGKDISDVMLMLMLKLETNDSKSLLRYLNQSPLAAKDALRDPITGITSPLGGTSSLLKANSVFDSDPIIGTTLNETLVSNRIGGSRVTGGGGADLFVIALRSNPFASETIITDFDQDIGSKIVLDTIDYEETFKPTYRVAKNQRKLTKLTRSNTVLIFDMKRNELLINANKKEKGYGSNGGVIARFENGAEPNAKDILLFDGTSVVNTDGSFYVL
jgi:hypothetical protein